MIRLFQTLKSFAKIVLQSRPIQRSSTRKGGRIIVMGNGPSLNDTIEKHLDTLKITPTVAVNFAALAPVFFDIKPNYYVMADPHFFKESDNGGNLDLLREALKRVDWAMDVFVPVQYRKAARLHYPNLTLRPFNCIGLEGYDAIIHRTYKLGMGIPRPRNVLIPAIMLAISEGYDEIVITGADHSWMKTISVTDENEVVSIQPHFYKENEKEEKRIRHDYRNCRLHEIVESFAIAFRSYHDIARYATRCNVSILNATPNSFIDAFPRIKL